MLRNVLIESMQHFETFVAPFLAAGQAEKSDSSNGYTRCSRLHHAYNKLILYEYSAKQGAGDAGTVAKSIIDGMRSRNDIQPAFRIKY